jgi:hypothetical protein
VVVRAAAGFLGWSAFSFRLNTTLYIFNLALKWGGYNTSMNEFITSLEITLFRLFIYAFLSGFFNINPLSLDPTQINHLFQNDGP